MPFLQVLLAVFVTLALLGSVLMSMGPAAAIISVIVAAVIWIAFVLFG